MARPVACSRVKALPTDEEIEAAGAGNAATYLNELRATSDTAYDQLLSTRAAAWGEPPSERQPLCRCVEHTIHIMIVAAGGDARNRWQLSTRQVRNQLEGTVIDGLCTW